MRQASQPGRPPSAMGQPAAGVALPPLNQPTGEVPSVDIDETPDQTLVVDSPPSSSGVFDEPGEPSAPFATPSAAHPGTGPRGSDAVSDRAPSAFDQPEASYGDVDDPFTQPEAPIAGSASPDEPFDVRPQGGQVGPASRFGAGQAPDVDLVAMEADDLAGPSDAAPTNPFPELDDFAPTPAAYAATGAAAAAAHAGQRQVAGADPYGPGGSDRPVSRQGGRPQDLEAGYADDRLQDTEFKLAGNRRRQRPKEPNRLILALALGVVVLVGVAAAWLLTRDGDAENAATTDEAGQAADAADATADDATTDADATPAQPEPQVDEPTLFFEAAQTGPIAQGETYSIDLVGEPEGSLLQVVVDDIPQGEAAPVLPDLILPAGRHSIHIEITNGAEVSASTPVEVYVVGDPPPIGYRANLSSVDMQAEGWVEAIRQFDEFRAAGHEGLMLAPLSPGYWNIFIGGLGDDRSAAQAYCESFSLAVPDECFPSLYEGPAPGEAGSADSTEDSTEGESMTEGDTTSTTAAGG